MLSALFSRRPPGPEHDHLFSQDSAMGPHLPAFMIKVTYGIAIQNCERDGGEGQPKYKHFKRLMEWLIAAFPSGVTDKHLRRFQSAYICCFEKHAPLAEELRIWQRDPPFRDLLVQTRHQLVKELIPIEERFQAYKRANRRAECWATPIDLQGETRLDQIKQMSRDDWHEIALTWNWDHGCEELAWITAQPACDLATAVHVISVANMGDVAQHWNAGHNYDVEHMVHAIAGRLGANFYQRADFRLDGTGPDWINREIARLHATGAEPWISVPADILSRLGTAAHKPKYTSHDPTLVYAYEYWLAHVAPPVR